METTKHFPATPNLSLIYILSYKSMYMYAHHGFGSNVTKNWTLVWSPGIRFACTNLFSLDQHVWQQVLSVLQSYVV